MLSYAEAVDQFIGRHDCETQLHLCTQRVLINSSGDMIVRPSFIEASLLRNSTSSVPQHLLASYQRAHVAIIKAQFTKKRLRNGTSVCVVRGINHVVSDACAKIPIDPAA